MLPPQQYGYLKTLKTQGKPLKTQGTQFVGIFRILLCEKDVPKKTLDAFIHFHTLSYALEGFTCAKKQNVVPSSSSSSATYTNVRLSRCAAGKKVVVTRPGQSDGCSGSGRLLGPGLAYCPSGFW